MQSKTGNKFQIMREINKINSQNKNKLKNPNIEPKKPSFFSRYFGFGRGIKSKKIKKNKKLKNNSVKRNLTKSKNKRKTSRK